MVDLWPLNVPRTKHQCRRRRGDCRGPAHCHHHCHHYHHHHCAAATSPYSPRTTSLVGRCHSATPVHSRAGSAATSPAKGPAQAGPAREFRVTGAGAKLCNGLYRECGKMNNRPQFKKVGRPIITHIPTHPHTHTPMHASHTHTRGTILSPWKGRKERDREKARSRRREGENGRESARSRRQSEHSSRK